MLTVGTRLIDDTMDVATVLDAFEDQGLVLYRIKWDTGQTQTVSHNECSDWGYRISKEGNK